MWNPSWKMKCHRSDLVEKHSGNTERGPGHMLLKIRKVVFGFRFCSLRLKYWGENQLVNGSQKCFCCLDMMCT